MIKVSPKRLADAAERAEKLVKDMSLTEKIGQLSQFGTSIYSNEAVYYADHCKEGKIGSYLSVSGAKLTNRLQKEFLDAAPHKIPLLFAYDVIHGYKTHFPTPLAQSASWNTEAVKRGCEISAKEAYRDGIRWTFSPMVDIARDPRWGRIAEGYGEDTYLCSKFAAAAVEGYQGDEIGEKDRLIACMKHFCGYGACVGGRDYDAVDMSLQTLYDVYLPPFKAGIDAGAATVMSAFHTLNGVPCTGNRMLLTDILRGMMKFNGFVISDAGAVYEMVPHGYAEGSYDSALAALKSGVNILMAGDQFNDEVPKMIANGDMTEEEIDSALLPVLVTKILLGLFENPYTDENEDQTFFCEEHRKAARNLGRECIILLKNSEILPLTKDKKVALIGPVADDKDNVLGTWCALKEIDTTVSLVEGFKNAGIDFVYAKGSDYTETNDAMINEAVAAAKEAGLAVLALGETHLMSGEAASRSSIHLPEAQLRLLDAVIESGVPTVVLISAGRPIVVNEFKDKVAALLYVWQLGTEFGNAVADVITGEYNVSGKLTTSVPRSEGQLPVYYNRTMTGRPERGNRWETGYKDITVEPDYIFGYGLSYTTFEYSDVSLSEYSMPTDGSIKVKCTVTNTGDRDGNTVAQLYVRDLVASCVRPIRELKGFERIFLKTGESKTVEFELKADDLAFHNAELKRVVEPGKFRVWIGDNAKDDARQVEFAVTE